MTYRRPLLWAAALGATVAMPSIGLGLSVTKNRERRLLLIAGALAHLAALLWIALAVAAPVRLLFGFCLVFASYAGLAAGVAARAAFSAPWSPHAGALSTLLTALLALFLSTTVHLHGRLALEDAVASQRLRDLKILADTFEAVARHMPEGERARLREEIWIPAALALRSGRPPDTSDPSP